MAIETAPLVPAAVRAPAGRIPSLDIVRGTVMVLMALDHVRDWVTNLRFRPEDLSQASAALFATRWVTHFCAPAFFLLAGMGIGILLDRGRQPREMSRYLFTRGIWLLVLELIITPIGWQFGFDLVPVFALVLWALGLSMIAMAAIVHLPRTIVAAGALVLIFGHNLLDGIQPDGGVLAGVWNVLHVPGFAIPGVFFVAYPLVPWVGVMALGSVMARAWLWEPARRRRLLIRTGIAACALFIALRAANAYGNPFPWSEQRTAALTVASFLNVLKYPPSLQFLLMTLGPVLLALALTENARGRVARWLAVYGRVPLFFYVVHIFVAHLAAVTLAFIQSGEPRRILVVNDPGSIPEWYGLPLIGVYAVWGIVVVLMYFPCRRFARLKNTRTDWWLRYL